MTFFDSIPRPPAQGAPQPRPAWAPPEGTLPGSVPGEVLLIRTDAVAVSIGAINAYPNGFEFTTHVRTRPTGGDEDYHDPFGRFAHRFGGTPGGALQLGLLYSDGRRGATSGHAKPDDPHSLLLHHQGSTGSSRRWDGRLWVHPLPPSGPVTVVAAWADRGIGETRTDLDGTTIVESAARALILWPETPNLWPGGAVSGSTVSAYKIDDDDE